MMKDKKLRGIISSDIIPYRSDMVPYGAYTQFTVEDAPPSVGRKAARV